MIVGVPVESYPKERRVALVPTLVSSLINLGLAVLVEKGAGVRAGFPDYLYEEQGASIAANRSQVFSTADVILQVHGTGTNPGADQRDLELLCSDRLLIGLFNPLVVPEIGPELAKRGVTTFSLELLPRISRAQPMDALTSISNISGYKAALMAAEALNKMFPMMITAAGTITPARVFVVGAGVAGLQAIATSNRLGAVVQAYDVRPEVREQVESLGVKFLQLDLETDEVESPGGYAKDMGDEFYRRQQEMMTQVVAESDVVITTAAVPGGKAPILITKEMVQKMRSGSVIIDLASESGGNCELTRRGESTEFNGVIIMGPINLSSSIPYHASQMYAGNLVAFLRNLIKDGKPYINLEDQIIRDTLLTHHGEVANPRVRELLGLPRSVS